MSILKSCILAVVLLTASATSSYSQTTATHYEADSLTTATVKVKGITCAMDLKMIAANVEKIAGVSSCTAGKQGTTTTFEVEYDASLVSEEDIYAAIQNTGSCENPDERPYKVKQQ